MLKKVNIQYFLSLRHSMIIIKDHIKEVDMKQYRFINTTYYIASDVFQLFIYQISFIRTKKNHIIFNISFNISFSWQFSIPGTQSSGRISWLLLEILFCCPIMDKTRKNEIYKWKTLEVCIIYVPVFFHIHFPALALPTICVGVFAVQFKLWLFRKLTISCSRLNISYPIFSFQQIPLYVKIKLYTHITWKIQFYGNYLHWLKHVFVIKMNTWELNICYMARIN